MNAVPGAVAMRPVAWPAAVAPVGSPAVVTTAATSPSHAGSSNSRHHAVVANRHRHQQPQQARGTTQQPQTIQRPMSAAGAATMSASSSPPLVVSAPPMHVNSSLAVAALPLSPAAVRHNSGGNNGNSPVIDAAIAVGQAVTTVDGAHENLAITAQPAAKAPRAKARAAGDSRRRAAAAASPARRRKRRRNGMDDDAESVRGDAGGSGRRLSPQQFAQGGATLRELKLLYRRQREMLQRITVIESRNDVLARDSNALFAELARIAEQQAGVTSLLQVALAESSEAVVTVLRTTLPTRV